MSKGSGEKLVVSLDVRAQAVAVLEGGLKAPLENPGLELSRAVLDVVEAAAPGELTNSRKALRSRAELSGDEGAPEVVAPQEAHLGVEVPADEQMIDEQAVEVVLVGERRLIALRVARQARRARARVVAVEVDVVVEREGPIDSIRLVRAIARQRDRPVGEDRADPTPPENVALDAEHAEVGRDGAGARRVVGLNVDGPHAEITHLAGQASAAQNRHGASLVQADPPAEEDGGASPPPKKPDAPTLRRAAPPPPAPGTRPKSKMP